MSHNARVYNEDSSPIFAECEQIRRCFYEQLPDAYSCPMPALPLNGFVLSRHSLPLPHVTPELFSSSNSSRSSSAALNLDVDIAVEEEIQSWILLAVCWC